MSSTPDEGEEVETTTSTTNNPHAAQWERQGEWLRKSRAEKQELQDKGVHGFDLLEAMATRSLNHKIAFHQQSNRCSHCWHDQMHCICSKLLSPLASTIEIPNVVKLCILMHHKEYLGAGNSAKLLLQLLPNHIIELYLFGKQGDVDRLFQDISQANAMILWPGENAISVSDFRENTPSTTTTDNEEPIHAIVLDGTYTQARNMHKSLRKRWGQDQMPIAVAVHPTSGSVFHRAQKNYGKAHLGQSQVLRVSTAEACGCLLTELGAPSEIQEKIVEAVMLNNQALAFARTESTKKGDQGDNKDGVKNATG